MPKHEKGESKKDWMKRCVPHLIKKEGLSPKHARGKCNGMYDTWKKKQRKHSELQEDDYMDDGKYEEGKYYELVSDRLEDTNKYWQEVKQEIQKL